MTEAIERLEQDLYKRVFMIFSRLSTPREQQQYGQYDQLTLDEYSDIIHSLWIFDVPKIFDICALFSSSNPELTRKLVTSVILSQPKYFADLVSHTQLLCAGIKSVAKQTWQLHLEHQQLKERNDSKDIKSKAMEIIRYLHDLVNTVYCFLSVFQYGVFAFRNDRVMFDTGFHFIDNDDKKRKMTKIHKKLRIKKIENASFYSSVVWL
eukprot:gb/GECH01009014.1/.p1 GENE.gb/GECH01009014.1/~~gb/GECH01009014.1/.p1  ORF type:complete len:208 (+),score=35.15 gb/GECH01009014.1/:1-624(+)